MTTGTSPATIGQSIASKREAPAQYAVVQIGPRAMATQPSGSAGVPGAPGWIRMERHVRIYLAAHPKMQGFQPATRSCAHELTAEIHYAGHTLRSRIAPEGWWNPCTPDRGRTIAQQLAHDLHSQWFAVLRGA